MTTLDFSDKSVTYDTFVHDVASSVVRMLSEAHNDPEIISQRQAYEMFGRGNVDRWRRQGKIEPYKTPRKSGISDSGVESLAENPTGLFQITR